MKTFIIGQIDQDLVDKFFDTEVQQLPTDTKLEDVLCTAGIFPSKSQARKAGFSGDVPQGCNILGTKKKKCWVWKSVA